MINLIAAVIVTYLICAFVTLKIDPTTWSPLARFISMISIAWFYSAFKDDWKTND